MARATIRMSKQREELARRISLERGGRYVAASNLGGNMNTVNMQFSGLNKIHSQLTAYIQAVSYTHLTLPTNREV